MENTAYAKVLDEIAALHRVAGDNRYKVRAFEGAARVVRDLSDPIDDLVERHRIEEISGIGESVATELQSLHDAGVSPRLLELRERVEQIRGIIGEPEQLLSLWVRDRRAEVLAEHDRTARSVAQHRARPDRVEPPACKQCRLGCLSHASVAASVHAQGRVSGS